MGYQQFIESNKKDPLEGVEIREDVAAWLVASPQEKADWIKEAKEHETSDYIIEVSKLSKEHSNEVIIALQEKVDPEQEAAAKKKVLDSVKGLSRKEFGKKLKSADDSIDTYQTIGKKMTGVPFIGKKAAKEVSQLGSVEAGTKVARGMNFVGFKPETSMKAGLGTMKGLEKGKEAVSDASGAVKKFASEHGGKTAAAVGAGLAALGAAKYLAGKRKKKKEEE